MAEKIKGSIGTIIMLILTVCGWVWVAAKKDENNIQNSKRLDKVEIIVDQNNGDIREMKTDVRWIRERLERKP